MPNWKKLIVSGSDAELNSLNITTALTASGLLYPTTDGSENQALVTDGAGNLSFGTPVSSSYALTASYALNGGGGGGAGFPFSGAAEITGSFLVSQSFVDFTLSTGVSGSFSGSFQGDGSELTGIVGLGLKAKSGCVATSSFSATGSSFYYDVVFDSSFASTDYSVTLQAHSQYSIPTSFPGHAWVDSDKATTGFRIVVPSFDDTTDQICWTAVAHGESEVTASYALTASYAENAGGGAGFPFSGSAEITGSLLVSQSFVDFTLATGVSGSFSGSFTGDGSGLTNLDVPQVATVTSSFADTSSITINHNFNSQNILVSVYDTDNNQIIPQTTNLVDNDNVRVDFANTSSGFVVVAKGGHIVSGSVLVPQVSTVVDSFTSSLSHTATHNFGTKNVIVSVYSGSDEVIIPSSIVTTNTASVTVTFPEEVTGRVVVVKAGHIVSGSAYDSNLLNGQSGSYYLDYTNFTNTPSASFSTRISDLETFSSSLDTSFVSETEFAAYTASANTGSFTGSFYGDGTGLTGLGYGDTKKLDQTVAATTWSFSHNMNEQYPTVTVYNDSNEVVQPSKIEAVDAQTLNLYFGSPTAGTAVAVVGGVATTQEAGFNRVLSQTISATTWSFEHNLGNKYPQVIVYDSNDELVIPGKVEAIDQNNLNIYFDSAQTGTATATVGGTSLTASYADTLVVTNTLLSTQENTDVDTGTETIATVSTLFYDSAFFDYSVNDGTNYRAGTIISVWSGSTVQFTDNSTADIGDTTPVTMSVDISGTDARLRATTSTDNWDIKAFVRAL